MSNRTLHEIYLPAFQQAVTRAKVASLMCAFSVINGNFACQNPYLETQVLRAALGLPRLRDLRLRRPAQHPGGGRRHRHGAAVRAPSSARRCRPTWRTGRSPVGGGHHGQPDRHRDVPVRDLQPPAGGTTGATVTTPAHQAVAARVAEDGTVLLQERRRGPAAAGAHAGTVAVIGPAASAAPRPPAAAAPSSPPHSASPRCRGCRRPRVPAPRSSTSRACPPTPACRPSRRPSSRPRTRPPRSAEAHRHAHRPADPHLRARDHQPVRLL